MSKLKRHSGITIFIAGAVIITAVIIFVVKLTAHYPELAEPVSYSVNQLNGFKMEIEGVHWSFRKGYWGLRTKSWTSARRETDVLL